MADRDIHSAIAAQLHRLGLDHTSPGLVVADGEPSVRLLGILQALSPGATWADVSPELTAEGHPISPPIYRPLGAWDHQASPGEAAFHILLEPPVQDWDKILLASARRDGIPIYGAGRLEQVTGAGLGPEHGFLVLARSTSEDDCDRVWEWLEAQPGFTIASRFR